MHEVIPQRIWIGHAGDLLKPAVLETAGIKAIIQVALAEPIPTMSRELLIAHFPILDGPGNSRGILDAAVGLTASLVRSRTPTLVCCSGGMSRSPSIVAGALALAQGMDVHEALASVVQGKPHDVSPGLWESVCAVVLAQKKYGRRQ